MAASVRVGGVDFEVLAVADLRDGNEKLDGQLHHDRSAIMIDAGLGPQAKFQTLWHEIVHAILTHSGRQEQDEGEIDAIAHGVMQVLKDNPELRKP